MADRRRTLARIHRVRTVQFNLAQADEARAADRVANETELSIRIARLADGVAPLVAQHDAVSFGAAAYYRARLHDSAAAAVDRVRNAEALAAQAGNATRAAKRDQSAVEKLAARAEAEAVHAALRALEELGSTVARKRHTVC